jgi:hypothetical protein
MSPAHQNGPLILTLHDGCTHSAQPHSNWRERENLRRSRVAEDGAFEALDSCGEVPCVRCLSGVALLLDPLADQHAWAYMLSGRAVPDPVQQ